MEENIGTIGTKVTKKFMFKYLTKEEETISIPESANIVKVDTVNGVPIIYLVYDENDTRERKILVKLVGPEDKYNLDEFSYLDTIKIITQARIQLNPKGPNIQETPLHILIKHLG